MGNRVLGIEIDDERNARQTGVWSVPVISGPKFLIFGL